MTARRRTEVRAVTPADSATWLQMRCELWPEGSEAEHADEIHRLFLGELSEPLAVLIAHDETGRAVGFVELSKRASAEGCDTQPVAFLEGWFVAAEARRTGVGRALTTAAESWARSQGCTEFASDTEFDNHTSIAAHLALGFEDVGLIRCFRKTL